MAPQSQSRLSAEEGPPQWDCTARVRAGQACRARVMAKSRVDCCVSVAVDGWDWVDDDIFLLSTCMRRWEMG